MSSLKHYILSYLTYVTILDHDFTSECDLHMACLILQKQIEHINGKKENIVIPSIRMKQIREQQRQIGKYYLHYRRFVSHIYPIGQGKH